MREVRNSDGRLVCRIDETTGTIEIKVKNCTTLIKRNKDGANEVVNLRNSTA